MARTEAASPGNRNRTGNRRGQAAGSRRGQFTKGRSGNPRGRPKSDLLVRELVAAKTRDGATIVATLVEVMTDRDARGSERVAAARELGDRLWGSAPKSIEHTGKGGGPIAVDHGTTLTEIVHEVIPSRGPNDP